MSESTRVFVAIAVPEPLERELTRLQSELAPAVPEFRWTLASPFHLTLAFIGDVPNDDLENIHRATAATAELIDPFDIEITGLGAFPSLRKPRVIWAGVTAPDLNPLFELQGTLVKALTRIRHQPNDDRFHPHLTLGRIKHRQSPNDLTGFGDRYRAWSAGQWTVAEVQVFASTLAPEGSVYKVLSRGRLRAKKTEGSA